MLEQSVLSNLSSPGIVENETSKLRQEYQACQNLFFAQSALVQQFLRLQAASLAETMMKGMLNVRFTLPDLVTLQDQEGDVNPIQVPAKYREQEISGLFNRFSHTNTDIVLRSRLRELEHSTNLAVSCSAILLRHAIVMHLVYNILPAGKSVQYIAERGDEIPNIPSGKLNFSNTDATEEIVAADFEGPYVKEAQGFYLPQWVAFDNQHHLLVGDVSEAISYITAMKRYLDLIQTAVGLAPYIVADQGYQQKRYGILGQLVNQGRALASYEVDEIIRAIKNRAAFHDLDRGLSLCLPYFNDQTMALETHQFNIIPMGRVMFVPAFVVLAVRAEGAKVAQDIRLTKSTRRHLLMELSRLEETFLR
jgi:hypothetical protein